MRVSVCQGCLDEVQVSRTASGEVPGAVPAIASGQCLTIAYMSTRDKRAHDYRLLQSVAALHRGMHWFKRCLTRSGDCRTATSVRGRDELVRPLTTLLNSLRRAPSGPECVDFHGYGAGSAGVLPRPSDLLLAMELPGMSF